MTQLLLLLTDAHAVVGIAAGPVNASDGREPYGSYFMLVLATEGSDQTDHE